MKNFYVDNLPDGKVRYRMSYKDPLTGKTKRLSASYDHDSVRNRRKAESDMMAKIEALSSVRDLSQTSLKQAIEDYHSAMRLILKDSTTVRNKATLDRVARQFPEGTLLSNINSQKWKSVLLEMSDNKVNTYNEYAKRVKRFLRWCYENDYINDINTFEKIRNMPDKEKKDRIADKYLEPEEIDALLDAMQGMTQWYLLTQFMILSGLRIGEAASLTWDDISNNTIYVTKTLYFHQDQITSTKTATSKREVAIQDELAECLKNIKEYNKFFGTVHVESDLVFPSKKGTHLSYFSYNKFLKENAAKCLSKKVTTHTLRHTHVSLLFAAGLPLDVISRRVGHMDSKITKEIYLHITQKVKKSDADLIKNIKLL